MYAPAARKIQGGELGEGAYRIQKKGKKETEWKKKKKENQNVEKIRTLNSLLKKTTNPKR